MMATRAHERARGHATPLPSPLLTRGPLRTEHAPQLRTVRFDQFLPGLGKMILGPRNLRRERARWWRRAATAETRHRGQTFPGSVGVGRRSRRGRGVGWVGEESGRRASLADGARRREALPRKLRDEAAAVAGQVLLPPSNQLPSSRVCFAAHLPPRPIV